MKKITVAFIAILLFAACKNGASKDSQSVVALEKSIDDNKRKEQADKPLNNVGNIENAPQQTENAKQTKPQILSQKKTGIKK